MKKYLKNIYLIFGVSFTLMIILSFLFYKRWQSFADYSDHVEHTYSVLKNLADLDRFLAGAESAQSSYLLLRDSSLLKRFTSANESIRPALKELQELMQNNPAQLDRLKLLQGAIVVRLGYLDAPVYQNKNLTKEQLRDHLEKGKRMMDTCHYRIREIETEERTMLSESARIRTFYKNVTPRFFSALMTLTILVTLAAFIMIIREARKRGQNQLMLEQNLLELDKNNKELEQINFAVSHDMQEPLRKIGMFGDRLKTRFGDTLSAEGNMLLDRIYSASKNMLALVEGLMNFTNLARNQEEMRLTDTNHLLAELVLKYEEEGLTANTKIVLGNLPSIYGYPEQLRLMFTALLDNSFQFARKDVRSVITVSAVEAHKDEIGGRDTAIRDIGFLRIAVTDNGEGFDNEYAEKIFLLFQQLEKDPDGKARGIGLAIVRRVMLNHQGFVHAVGTPGKGCTFYLYFPMAPR